jgi:hypothetical protein
MDGPQYPHTLLLNSPRASIALRSDDWRFGYEYLGRFAADGKAISSVNPVDIICAPRCWPLSQYDGSGKVEGLFLEYTAHFGPGYFVEAGPWIYRATWSEVVPDWLDPSHMALGPHQTVLSSDKTSLGLVAGIGQRFRHFEAVFDAHMAQDRGSQPSIVKQVILGAEIRYTL